MRSELRYRQVHLDFHTSEHIPDVGLHFDADQFVDTLKRACVDSVTVFARCHHGWCYYPSRVGKPHPNLKRPDLLGEMVQACRANNINVPIYLTVQWDERMAREHPEWRVMSANNLSADSSAQDPSAQKQLTARWHPLCLNNEDYLDYVTRLTLEVMEGYSPDGLFMDILLPWQCVCPRCLVLMQSQGLDPEKREERLANDRRTIMDFYRKFSESIWNQDPDMRLFFNSGHIYRGERDRYRYFSHLEIESLPTGGWGYDHFPVSARHAGSLGMEFLGMTGKFHTAWGEFGGYKRAVALEYECALMAALGARCSIGDQLHPSGKMDRDTYELIGPAYARIEKLEPFLKGARPESEIALLSAAAVSPVSLGREARENPSDDGAARMLLELQEMFDVIDLEADFGGYRLLVLPDAVTFTPDLTDKIAAFLAEGGRLILSGSSGMRPDESGFALKLAVQYEGQTSPFDPDYMQVEAELDSELVSSPFVIYDRAYAVKADRAEVLATSRNPYFNRSWAHFCSHQHTPYTLERNDSYDAVMQDGPIVYFSHPIFRAYYNSGQPLLKYLFRGALNRLLPERKLRVKLPSSGRVSLMRQELEKRWLLHLLFAQPQLRGSKHPYPDGRERPIEIIEDVVPVRNIPCRLSLDREPRRVYSAYSGQAIPYGFEDGILEFTVGELYIHELVVIEELR